jgi:hypothetical protein
MRARAAVVPIARSASQGKSGDTAAPPTRNHKPAPTWRRVATHTARHGAQEPVQKQACARRGSDGQLEARVKS